MEHRSPARPEPKGPRWRIPVADVNPTRKRIYVCHLFGKMVNPKISQKGSYGQVTTCHFQMAVIDSDNPFGKLSQDKADLVKAALWRKLEAELSAPISSATHPLAFMSWTYAEKILRISCCDGNLPERLVRAIESIKP